MKYTPILTNKEIEENHRHFSERISLYREKGLDFVKSREFIIEKARPLKGNTLEIGTGTGYTTLALAKAGCDFISIDKDKEALKTAALNLAYENVLFNVEFHLMDGKSLDFANGSFNSIVVVNLFHHIDNVNEMLSEIDRVLCARGKLVLGDFNKMGMQIVEAVHRQEKREHENSGVIKNNIYSYFHGLGYETKNYEEKYHWVLIAKKIIQK